MNPWLIAQLCLLGVQIANLFLIRAALSAGRWSLHIRLSVADKVLIVSNIFCFFMVVTQ